MLKIDILLFFIITIIAIMPTAVILLPFYFKTVSYNKSIYKRKTGHSFLKVYRDKGLYGEYLIQLKLEKVSGYHKSVLNCYIPTSNGSTTEIDLVFIHETGIYVIESKNYSGWIFGKENDKKWCQMLPNKQKKFFYNPILQNSSHMKALKNILPNIATTNFISFIVFSERCELKKITTYSDDIYVMKRSGLNSYTKNNFNKMTKKFTKSEIDRIYMTINSYANVSEELKEKHILDIKFK